MKKLISLLFLALLTTIAAAQVSKTINVTTAGTLGTSLTATEKTTVSNLTVTGIIDARDVKIIRDNMPMLEVLDLNAVTIVAYTGTAGTGSTSSSTAYAANEMPQYSFFYTSPYVGKATLLSIIFPNSVTAIGSSAIKGCTGLTSVTIPSSVTSIRSGAFENCTGLTSVTIPSSVISIDVAAFRGCLGLTTITIPSSVNRIYDWAFQNCSGLTSIYAYSSTPINLSLVNLVFDQVNTTSCILYVPPFSLSLYKSANQWMDFRNIINIPNIITTTQLTNITTTTASGGGNLTDNGGFTVTARGVCWSTTTNPTLSNSKTTNGTGTGTFISNITGLNPGTTYYIRAYATNSTGTAYGDALTFTTLSNTGISENTAGGIEIYPNPTKNNVNIYLSSTDFNGYNVNIFNSLGQNINSSKLQQVQTSIELSKLGKQGIYYLQISNYKGFVVGVEKIILE